MITPTPETNAIVRNAANADHPMTRLAATLTVKCEKLERERNDLLETIRETLRENPHLADGDHCTLKKLKDASARYSHH